MKILLIAALTFLTVNAFASCLPPAEFYEAIPQDLSLVTTDGKYSFSRKNQSSVMDVYEIASINNPRLNWTRYMLSDFSNGPVVRNSKTLKCHFTVSKEGDETVISFKLHKRWNDTGGYITRNTGNIVIKEGKVVSAELKDETSYKYFTGVFFPFQLDESFQY